jgi:hypothetical protein
MKLVTSRFNNNIEGLENSAAMGRFAISAVPDLGVSALITASASASLDYLVKKDMEAYKKQFKLELASFRSSAGPSLQRELQSRIDVKDYRSAYSILKDELRKTVGNQHLQGANENLRNDIQDFEIAQLRDLLITGFDVLEENIRANNRELRNIYKENAEGIRQLNAVIEKQGTAIASIAEGQEALKYQVNTLSQQLTSQSQSISSTQAYIFNKMTYEEKVSALADPNWFPGLQGKDRETFLKSIEESTKWQRTITGGLEAATDILNIASSLGFKGKTFEQASKAVEFAHKVYEGYNAASSAFSSFATGNYLGALSSVAKFAGVFGGRVDASAQRHKQLVSMLRAIDQKLTIMDQKLDFIIKNQDLILKNQESILKSIYALNMEMDRHFLLVNQKLDNILILEDLAIKYLESSFRSQFSSCLELSRNNRSLFDLAVLRQAETRPADVTDCQKCMYQVFEGRAFLQYYLLAPTEMLNDSRIPLDVANRINNSVEYYKKYRANFNLVTSLLEKHFNGNGADDQLTLLNFLISSLNPVINEREWVKVRQINTEIYRRFFRENTPSGTSLFSLVKQPVSTSRVVEKGTMLYSHHPLMLYFSQVGGKNPESRYEDLSRNIIEDFNKNIILLDVAIIQQNLLTGGTLLPIFKEALQGPEQGEKKQIVLQLLNDSAMGQVFASNFLMYILGNPIGEATGAISPYLYEELFEFKNVGYMQKYVDRVSSNLGWQVKLDTLGNYQVRFDKKSNTWWNMPHPTQYRSGIYYSSEGILNLIQLRNALLVEKLKYSDKSILGNDKGLITTYRKTLSIMPEE